MLVKLLVSTCLLLLNACSNLTPTPQGVHEMVYPIDNPYAQEYQDNPSTPARPLPQFVNTAEAPQTQMSAKHVDLSWVEAQEPQHLTILLNSDSNPLNVSQSLMKVPKDKRSAALKYQDRGQAQYAGIYGSFQDQNEAQQALQQLPEELRPQAKIVNWQQLQTLQYD